MGFAELSSVEKLRRLFEAFNEKRDILQLLDLSLQGQGVQIFIGQESGYQILDDCSVVTAPYSTDNGAVGVIGVIGPTRMAYERVIPVVDLTAQIARRGLEFPALSPISALRLRVNHVTAVRIVQLIVKWSLND